MTATTSMEVSTFTTTLTPTTPPLIGYYSFEDNGVPSVTSCDATFQSLVTTSSTLGVCCEGTACLWGVACSGTVKIYHNGITYHCPTDSATETCYQQTIYELYPNSEQGWSVYNYECGPDTAASKVYRTVVQDITYTVSQTDVQVTGEGTQEDSTDSAGGHNVAAIAGGTVGGVVGLGILFGAVFIYSRRKKKRAELEIREIGVRYSGPPPALPLEENAKVQVPEGSPEEIAELEDNAVTR